MTAGTPNFSTLPAVMTGTLKAQLRRMPDTPAPIEMPHIHEAIMSPDTWATSAAWKKITAGPQYAIPLQELT